MNLTTESIMSVVAERFELENLQAVLVFGSFGTELFNDKSDIDIIIIGDSYSAKKAYFFKGNLAFDCQLFKLDELNKLLINKYTRTHWIESMSNATILHDSSGGATKLIEEAKTSHIKSSKVNYEKAVMASQTVRCRYRKIVNQKAKNYLYFSALHDLLEGMYIITCFNHELQFFVHAPLRNNQMEIHKNKFDWLNRIISNTNVFDSHKLVLEDEVNKMLLTVCDDGV